MENIDIFKKATPQSGEFFKFKAVGDGIQGTYIDQRDAIDSFNNDQTIYILQDKDGKIWNLGFRKTASVIHDRMKTIRYGQIVGYRFDEERDSKKNPGTKVKIIRIYADPKLIDAEWINNQKELDAISGLHARGVIAPSSGNAASLEAFDEAISEAPAENPKSSTDAAVAAIINLAKTKGLVKEDMKDADAIEVIEIYTKEKLEEANMSKIIIALTGYKK